MTMSKLFFLFLVASWIENVWTDPSFGNSEAYASASVVVRVDASANASADVSANASADANANAVYSPTPQQPVDTAIHPWYANRQVYDCSNNYCVRRYCDEAEPGPDCEFEGTCVVGDLCKEGYLISRDGYCIPEDECRNPGQIACKDDKVFSNCVNGGCGRVKCSQLRLPPLCIDIAPQGCIPDCVCKDDKLLTVNGTCVAAEECPGNEVCPYPHEVFDPCLSTCPSQYCPDLVDFYECPLQPKPGDPDCEPGCRCEEGYYKNNNLECVPLNDCPPLHYNEFENY